jgi:hypothetical protein
MDWTWRFVRIATSMEMMKMSRLKFSPVTASMDDTAAAVESLMLSEESPGPEPDRWDLNDGVWQESDGYAESVFDLFEQGVVHHEIDEDWDPTQESDYWEL